MKNIDSLFHSRFLFCGLEYLIGFEKKKQYAIGVLVCKKHGKKEAKMLELSIQFLISKIPLQTGNT